MDISKLPRMSETSKHAPPPPPPPPPPTTTTTPQQPASPVVNANQTQHEPRDGIPPARYAYDNIPSSGAEAWISIAVGVILTLMAPRIWQYTLSQLFGTSFTWTFSDAAGNPLPYTKSVFFWGDLAMALFAVVLVVEGVALGFARRRVLVAIALVLTVLTTLFNLGYIAWMMQGGYGLQIMSALAVAFGVYIAIYQKRMLALLP
jgi:hypothetical protein